MRRYSTKTVKVVSGETSSNGNVRMLRTDEPGTRGSERTEVPFRDARIDAPRVISCQPDMGESHAGTEEDSASALSGDRKI